MSCIFRHTDNIPDITTTNDVYSEKNHCVRRFKLSLSHPRLLLLTLLKQSELLYSARRCSKPVLSVDAGCKAGRAAAAVMAVLGQLPQLLVVFS